MPGTERTKKKKTLLRVLKGFRGPNRSDITMYRPGMKGVRGKTDVAIESVCVNVCMCVCVYNAVFGNRTNLDRHYYCITINSRAMASFPCGFRTARSADSPRPRRSCTTYAFRLRPLRARFTRRARTDRVKRFFADGRVSVD